MLEFLIQLLGKYLNQLAKTNFLLEFESWQVLMLDPVFLLMI